MAGVAVNTASTILNRRPNSWASEATSNRVFEAAKELGYRPNRAAQALQSGKYHSIGLLVPDLNNPYFSYISSLMGELVEAKGYELVIESWRADLGREKKLLASFGQRNVDAVALFASDVESHRELFEFEAKAGIPMLVMAMPGSPNLPVDMVMPDFEAGIREAVDRLYVLGHRDFVFLAARSEGQRVGQRPNLFLNAVNSYEGCKAKVVKCGHAATDAKEAAKVFLSEKNRPTAVMALNDYSAFGVLRAAKECGLRVPEDLSVVGIDGIPLAEQLTISLATIAMPHKEMMEKTVEILLRRIDSEGELLPARAVFQAKFIERESVGAVGGMN